MRILQVNSFFTEGGSAKIVCGLYRGLIAAGEECIVAAARGVAETYGDNIYRIAGKQTAYLNALQVRLFDNDGFVSRRATLGLIHAIRSYNPDLVHLHNLHGYYIDVSLLFPFLRDFGKPVMWTLHDCWAFTGHCAWFSAAGCDKWSRNSCDGHCSQTREYPTCWLRGNAGRNFGKKRSVFTGLSNLSIVTPSYWLADCVRKSFLGNYDIRVIPNGVDLRQFHPVDSNVKSRLGIEGKTLLLGVAMRWTERKRLDDFIQLASLLDDNFVILLIGLSKSQLKSLPKNIIGLTVTDSACTLADYYSAADLFLNLSEEESFGLVTVEALACGTPVIVRSVTACAEPVDDTCGIVLDENSDIKDLAEIITAGKWRNFTATACLHRATQIDASLQFANYHDRYSSLIYPPPIQIIEHKLITLIYSKLFLKIQYKLYLCHYIIYVTQIV